MKRVFSRALLAGGLLLASCVASVGYAAETGVPKPDAAKGEQLYVKGDASRGILACVTCHGAAGNSTIAANPNLSAQAHEYLVKQLTDFKSKDGKAAPLRRGEGGANTAMTGTRRSRTPAWP